MTAAEAPVSRLSRLATALLALGSLVAVAGFFAVATRRGPAADDWEWMAFGLAPGRYLARMGTWEIFRPLSHLPSMLIVALAGPDLSLMAGVHGLLRVLPAPVVAWALWRAGVAPTAAIVAGVLGLATPGWSNGLFSYAMVGSPLALSLALSAVTVALGGGRWSGLRATLLYLLALASHEESMAAIGLLPLFAWHRDGLARLKTRLTPRVGDLPPVLVAWAGIAFLRLAMLPPGEAHGWSLERAVGRLEAFVAPLPGLLSAWPAVLLLALGVVSALLPGGDPSRRTRLLRGLGLALGLAALTYVPYAGAPFALEYYSRSASFGFALVPGLAAAALGELPRFPEASRLVGVVLALATMAGRLAVLPAPVTSVSERLFEALQAAPRADGRMGRVVVFEDRAGVPPGFPVFDADVTIAPLLDLARGEGRTRFALLDDALVPYTCPRADETWWRVTLNTPGNLPTHQPVTPCDGRTPPGLAALRRDCPTLETALEPLEAFWAASAESATATFEKPPGAPPEGSATCLEAFSKAVAAARGVADASVPAHIR